MNILKVKVQVSVSQWNSQWQCCNFIKFTEVQLLVDSVSWLGLMTSHHVKFQMCIRDLTCWNAYTHLILEAKQSRPPEHPGTRGLEKLGQLGRNAKARGVFFPRSRWKIQEHVSLLMQLWNEAACVHLGWGVFCPLSSMMTSGLCPLRQHMMRSLLSFFVCLLLKK